MAAGRSHLIPIEEVRAHIEQKYGKTIEELVEERL